MGIRIDGASDLINATDGSLTIEGQSINTTGIVTATGGMKVGTAATIHSTGQLNIGVAATIASSGNASFAGMTSTAYLSVAGVSTLTGQTNFGLPGIGATINPNGNASFVGVITAKAADLQTGPLNVGTAATISANGNATFSGIVTTSAVDLQTGPLNVGTAATISANGNATFSGIVTAANFVGDGSGLTNAGPALTGSTNNTVVTVTGSNAIAGEANLTFDGETLQVVSHVIGTKYADVLILGSGGGGGTSGGEGGGGGAGAFAKYYGVPLRKGKVYTATIGAGGPGAVSYSDDNGEGNKTTFTGPGAQISPAPGGGCGGCYPLEAQKGKAFGTGKTGASGGGGGGNYNGDNSAPHWGGNGTAGGYPGGHGLIDTLYLGGGGGGAGARGSMGSGSTGGNGGDGVQDSITGSATYYCGGGGGNSNGGPNGSGGQGGGGNNTSSGTANSGGGGGAGGGTGGSGVVILRVLTTDYSGASTSGSPTVTTDGSYTVIKFTGTGTYTA